MVMNGGAMSCQVVVMAVNSDQIMEVRTECYAAAADHYWLTNASPLPPPQNCKFCALLALSWSLNSVDFH